ncbi:D-alanyl-D-alanine carboxypeptidase family protein [Anaerobacillus isosaccharinicus]|uniref:serine-type D-Ala-D-Ala carboxypeptidase n=1 Tax=Anaerobacillus isosaccharinicus TaxID=1532552 RepID=A0A1S2MFF5_9BACI|nr:D-alanyl-D-alanine carboxypeptidase family protein [Anaerobacillus isosaccharinicus]MBA5584197.1 D-alanyl-D-alanine carboxypeptidase [Anaerobacillus isosaccharinicus]QOY37399.1 D-alanyl-D-alanine carboxypeptidase [Anaerobacillus isosaccharinicus]
MRKNISKIVIASFLSVLLLMSTFSFPVQTKANFDTNAYNSIMLDAETGKILFQKNIDILLPIASMSKMMSEYLVLEAINTGKIRWDQIVPISTEVAAVSHNTSLSNVHLRIDEQYTVKELYESVAIYSANGATMALAELISGSYPQFIKLMNETAVRIGMGLEGQDFKFINSTGLPNKYVPESMRFSGTSEIDENLMTARATATLAYQLINNYPEVLETASIPRKVFKEGSTDQIRMDNWNWMLPELVYGFEYTDGLKTGFTNAAGYCFTGTAKKDGQRVISVVMKTESPQQRFDETKRLMDYGFNNFAIQQLIPAGFQLEDFESLPVSKGKEREVGISTSEALSVMMKNGEEELYSLDLILDESLFDEEGKLIAPIEKGQQVGYMKVNYHGDVNHEFIVPEAALSEQVPVVLNESVEKAGWFSLTMRAIGGFFSGIWTSVANTVKGIFS